MGRPVTLGKVDADVMHVIVGVVATQVLGEVARVGGGIRMHGLAVVSFSKGEGPHEDGVRQRLCSGWDKEWISVVDLGSTMGTWETRPLQVRQDLPLVGGCS